MRCRTPTTGDLTIIRMGIVLYPLESSMRRLDGGKPKVVSIFSTRKTWLGFSDQRGLMG